MLSYSLSELAKTLPFMFFAALVGVLGALVAIGLYVYFALALSTIAKKLKFKNPWLAWIPVANLFLLPLLTKRHWAWGFLLFVPFVNIVFLIICLWDLYEKRGVDGRWSLLVLGHFAPYATIPLLSLGAFIANLLLLGYVAWGKK